MISSYRLFSNLFTFFSKRRLLLVLPVICIIALSVIMAKRIEVAENIKSMLPDHESEVSSDFSLIQRIPFSKKIIINLNAGPEMDTAGLFKAADELMRSMTLPYFSRVVSGPDMALTWKIHEWILQTLPNFTTQEDLEAVKARLLPEYRLEKLHDIHKKLSAPEGLILKGSLRNDPLEFSAIGYQKLRYINFLPKARLSGNRFLSEDGKNTLILADTPVENTDFREGKRLVDHLQALMDTHLPPYVEASFISAHRYTISNAETMKKDVWIVLTISSILILATFLLFLRSVSALFVYMIPFCSLAAATAGTAFIFHEISAITIGFGAVLLGISVDYALHIYFALRRSHAKPELIIGEASRPILFSGYTTLVAFSVLLFSDLPGQRQLSIFTLIGIGFSLILSLIVLPHFIRTADDQSHFAVRIFKTPSPAFRNWIIGGWMALSAASLWAAGDLRFEGDLGVFNLVPQAIQNDELRLKKTWGDIRNSAMIFVRGSDLETTLQTNERLFAALSKRFPDINIVSLAPILPSEATQISNRRGWINFWTRTEGEKILVDFKTEAALNGFSEEAFSPFFSRLNTVPQTILPETLIANGLGHVVDALLSKTENGFLMTTLVPDTEDITKFVFLLGKDLPGIRLVSQSRFRESISRAISTDFIRFLVYASIAVTVLIALLFRNLFRMLLVLLPIATGLILMMGFMGTSGLSFNIFNIIAAILVIGLGVDYGIFMVYRLTEKYGHQTEQAILTSGLTTLAGFGALILARHPALKSIGITVLIGIGTAIPTALWVIPAIYLSLKNDKGYPTIK